MLFFKPFVTLPCSLILGLFSLAALAETALVDSHWGRDFADAIMARYQPTIDVATGAGWDHSNSVVMHGMEKLYLKTKNPTYLEYIKRYVDTFLQSNGEIKTLRNTLDGMHPGVLCLFLYEQTGDKKYWRAAKTMKEHLLGKHSTFNRTPDGAFWHKNVDKYRNVATVDGLYMVHPFLVRYGLQNKDETIVNTALEQIFLVSERSLNIKFGLPYHAWNYDKTKVWAHPVTGTSTQFWSRASGWYSMALVDILEVLPKQHKHYSKLLQLFQELAAGLKKVQHPVTGFWYQVLNKNNAQDNYPEASGTGMITYALQKGLNLGLLPESYAQVTTASWKALTSTFSKHADGGPQANSVAPGMGAQNNYAAYVAIRPMSVPSTAKKQHMHGYMAALMAASVMEFPTKK